MLVGARARKLEFASLLFAEGLLCGCESGGCASTQAFEALLAANMVGKKKAGQIFDPRFELV